MPRKPSDCRNYQCKPASSYQSRQFTDKTNQPQKKQKKTETSQDTTLGRKKKLNDKSLMINWVNPLERLILIVAVGESTTNRTSGEVSNCEN